MLISAGNMLWCIQGGLSSDHSQWHWDTWACQHWPPRNQRCVFSAWFCFCLCFFYRLSLSSLNSIMILIFYWLGSTATSAWTSVCHVLPRRQMLNVHAQCVACEQKAQMSYFLPWYFLKYRTIAKVWFGHIRFHSVNQTSAAMSATWQDKE